MAHRNHRKRQNVKMAAARIEGSVDQRRGAKGVEEEWEWVGVGGGKMRSRRSG
jgi:hypothetical protein